ncbi:hypothetical protein NDU88_001662, partial [Pleurodeles waltl]
KPFYLPKMAMLAEPRRKQKWSVDPRNTAWSKDESKFGQKMLEKMGWSKGKGLGAKEQGSTEHIKVQLKNNTLGLGAAVNHEDSWLAHQDDFNQILAQLNNCHGQNEADLPATEEKKCFSLEEKSKTSKKRVHYMKFAKGKDLSCRSDTDLACIFGKRPKSRRPAEVDTSADSRDDDDDDDDDDVKQNGSPLSDQVPEAIGNTVTSTLSVAEYFAKRMAQLKKSQMKEGAKPAGEVPDNTAEAQSSEEPSSKSKKKRKGNEEQSSCCKEEPKDDNVEQFTYEDH